MRFPINLKKGGLVAQLSPLTGIMVKLCKKVNQWSAEQVAEFLAASLQGNALRILGDGPKKKFTYGELVKGLEKRFGPGQLADNY